MTAFKRTCSIQNTLFRQRNRNLALYLLYDAALHVNKPLTHVFLIASGVSTRKG